MSQNKTSDRYGAKTAIFAIALLIPVVGGMYTSCDSKIKKADSVTVEEQVNPPINPGPNPVPVPIPTPTPGGGNPVNQWFALSNNNPPTARASHTAVWTGTRMIIWGGTNGTNALADGSSLDPLTGTWTAISAVSAPSARFGHAAAWDGTRMVIWGGRNNNNYFNDGYAYTPSTNSWAALTAEETIAARAAHSMVYTGQTFLMWGGATATSAGLMDGGHYLLNSFWNALIGQAPALARAGHSAVWTGSKMLMFGGQNNGVTSQDGYTFDPATNIFTSWIVSTNTPANRTGHSAVWTGSRMVIWGGMLLGVTTSYYADGRYFDPNTSAWTVMSATGAPVARAGHSAVWAGDAMIIWGGASGPNTFYNNGAVFK